MAMFCQSCTVRTTLLYDVDAPAARMKICAECYGTFRAGGTVTPARRHEHGHRSRWGDRQLSLPPEQFR